MRGPETDGAAGVGQHHVDLGELRRQRLQHLFVGGAIGDVEIRRVTAGAELLLQGFQPVGAAAGGDDAGAGAGEAARRRGAETGGRAGDEHGEILGIEHLGHGRPFTAAYRTKPMVRGSHSVNSGM